MDKNQLAQEAVDHLLKNDLFSDWLGIEVMEIKEGYSKIKMLIRPD